MVQPHKLLILSLLLLLTTTAALLRPRPVRAAGWELTTGRIVKLVRGEEYVELTIRPETPAAAAANPASSNNDTAAAPAEPGGNPGPAVPLPAAPAPLVLSFPRNACPGNLAVGDRVRIWSKTLDAATVYRVLRRCGNNDPTGVRARLRRHGRRFGGRRGGRGGHGGGR